MQKIRDTFRKTFSKVEPLPVGTHHLQSSPEADIPYHLHLRLEPDGSGLLIVNAHTILHLNRTAAELAYHLIKGDTPEKTAQEIEKRYRVSSDQAQKDYQELVDRIQILVNIQDVDPVTYLDFDRRDPYGTDLSAPYRLDCAITYRLPANEEASAAPTDRVTTELTTNEWISILDKAWNAGIPQIVFTGGEPTLREDLSDLIAYTQKVGQVSGLLTDGLLLRNTDYFNSLLQAGLDHLLFVLQPQSDASWEALQAAIAQDIFVTAHLTVSPETQANTSRILERLAAIGVKNLSLSTTDLDLTPILQEARQQAAALALSLVWDLPVPYSHMNPVAFEKEDSVPDGAGRAWLYVEPDGDVLPGQGINRVLGNLLRDPWDLIWKNHI